MRTRSLIRASLLLSLLVLFGGCATRALWTETNLDSWNEPADPTNLRLFDRKDHKDRLVVYDEYSERTDSVHTRAYWLQANEERILGRKPPAFVALGTSHRLVSMPLFAPTNAPFADPSATYAVGSPDGRTFTIISGKRTTGPCSLPVYNDGSARAKRIALTPLAVAADITIVGGFIVYLGLDSAARSGYPVVFYSQ